MNLKSKFAVLAAVALLAAPAQALTLTNKDDKAYEVTVMEGEGDGAVRLFDIEAGGELFEFCANGCTIRLDDGDEMGFYGDEEVTIENGQFIVAQ